MMKNTSPSCTSKDTPRRIVFGPKDFFRLRKEIKVPSVPQAPSRYDARDMASARSIEVKVGLLILTAVVLLAGFILVMGGINFQPTFEISIGFDNPGGLQSGAPVKVAGVKVGKVTQMEFSGGRSDQGTGERAPLVVARVAIEKRFQQSIHDNSVFYITTQGVLGEQFLAIEPGSNDRPVLEDGASVRGLDPPRLDRLIAESYDLLHTTVAALREHRPQIRDAFEGLGKTLRGTAAFFEHNQDRLDRIAENVEKMTEEGIAAVRSARERVDNPAIDRILANAEQLSAVGARDVPTLLAEGRQTLGHANKAIRTLSSDEELGKIKSILSDAQTATRGAKLAVADAQLIAAHIRRGKGSVGALVMDEQLFDDLQELARDLKHNPWKFFWKE